jgi:hypothetical protein
MTRLAARFGYNPNMIRSETPLSLDQVRRVAPSIFAEGAHSSRSERYAYIPTAEVLRGLLDAGFQPFMAGQARTRIEGKREFTRHMLRLRHVSLFKDNDAAQEIILINSHDGTSSYQLISGVFRFVCMNGMVCGDVDDEIRVHHKGNIRDQVIDAAFEIVKGSERRHAMIEDMRETNMSGNMQNILAQEAIALRFGSDNTTVITPDQALVARRPEDEGDSQWNVMNRIQENLTHGGMLGRNRSNKVRRVRPITGMDKDTQFNRSLNRLMQAYRDEVARLAA